MVITLHWPDARGGFPSSSFACCQYNAVRALRPIEVGFRYFAFWLPRVDRGPKGPKIVPVRQDMFDNLKILHKQGLHQPHPRLRMLLMRRSRLLSLQRVDMSGSDSSGRSRVKKMLCAWEVLFSTSTVYDLRNPLRSTIRPNYRDPTNPLPIVRVR